MTRKTRERNERKTRLARELRSLLIAPDTEALEEEGIIRWVSRMNIHELREMLRLEKLDAETATSEDLLYTANVRSR